MIGSTVWSFIKDADIIRKNQTIDKKTDGNLGLVPFFNKNKGSQLQKVPSFFLIYLRSFQMMYYCKFEKLKFFFKKTHKQRRNLN